MLENKATLDVVYVDNPDDLVLVGKKAMEALLENQDGKYKGHLRLVITLQLESVHTFHNGVK
jgi:hypothetical protein